MSHLARYSGRVLLLLIFLAASGALVASAQTPDSASSPEVTGERVYSSSEVTRAAVVVEKPKPEYRKEAGEKDVSGTVVVQLVLSSTGKVRDVSIVEGLSTNQNNAAMKAARQIKFIPAVKDGEQVSQSLTVEYPFQFHRIEDGSLSELRAVKRIYVDAGANEEEQRNITGEILKYLPDLTIVDTAREAEVILAFNASERTQNDKFVQKDAFTGEVKNSWNIRLDMEVGHGQVLRQVTPTTLRSLLKFEDPHTNKFERKPSTNFARAFVKAYKQANGLEED
jgi:TonB family protein